MDSSTIEITVLTAMSEISALDWDACAAPETADGGRPLDPFSTHRFLSALEESGSVPWRSSPRSSWRMSRSAPSTSAFAPR